MKTSIKSTWQGLIPVRDVFVNRALNANEPLEVSCKGEVFVLTIEQMRNPVMKKEVKDYFSGAMQKLLYYGKPKKENVLTNQQPTLL